MNNNHVDLHLHTVVSDGLHTPAEIVQMAHAKGLRVISISDHDTVDGIAEAQQAALGTGVEVIPGVEVSTDVDVLEIHILGYFVDYADEEFVSELARFRASRLERARTMLSKLRDLGVPVSWERVKEIAGDGVVGRPHVARAMLEAGHVGSSQEAFDLYLGRGKPAYVPRLKMTPAGAMHLIRKAGGLPVLAHPWGVTAILSDLVREGLVGLEAYYTGYSAEMSDHLCRLARQYDLVCTGGSDFHGLDLLPDNRLGQVYVPDECVEALRERKRLLDEID